MAARHHAPPVRGTILRRVRKREATRIGVRHPGPATQVARCPLARAATVTVADGRNFRRWPRLRLPGSGRVNQPDAQPWEAQRTAVRTDRRAVRDPAATVQRAVATADTRV